MTYYRVKPEFDNFIYDKNFNFFIGKELYTAKELIIIRKAYNRKPIFDSIFEAVEISKNKIHWFFGARFED